MHFPIKRLEKPQPVFNVDGTRHKNGDIKHYTDVTGVDYGSIIFQ
jgi:hypothetical protein